MTAWRGGAGPLDDSNTLWIAAALGTAAAFAVSSIIAYDAARALGAVAFSFLRVTLVAAGFLAWSVTAGIDPLIDGTDLLLLSASGFLGVFLGDALRYSALSRVGPRLQSVVHSTSAPFAMGLGVVFLSQHIAGAQLWGTLIVVAATLIAVVGQRKAGAGPLEGDRHTLISGVVFGLAAALVQALSVLVAAPVMLKGVDPISATAVRSTAGALSIMVPALLSYRSRQQILTMSPRVATQVVLSAAIGTGLGMTLQLYALAHGPVGIVATLSATTPIMLVPLVWVASKTRPGWRAWTSAALAVLGVWLVTSR